MCQSSNAELPAHPVRAGHHGAGSVGHLPEMAGFDFSFSAVRAYEAGDEA